LPTPHLRLLDYRLRLKPVDSITFGSTRVVPNGFADGFLVRLGWRCCARVKRGTGQPDYLLAAQGIVFTVVIVAVIVTAESYEGFSLIAGETR
jgi:hypothetical protein